jgi:hypothetical protein
MIAAVIRDNFLMMETFSFVAARISKFGCMTLPTHITGSTTRPLSIPMASGRLQMLR